MKHRRVMEGNEKNLEVKQDSNRTNLPYTVKVEKDSHKLDNISELKYEKLKVASLRPSTERK